EVKKLLGWRSSVFRRWSQSLLDKGDADGSLKVLIRAFALGADAEIVAGIAYHTQTALPIKEWVSLAAMIEHFDELRKQFPKVNEVSEGGKQHAARAVNKLADDKAKFKEAVEAVDRYRPLFMKPEHRAEVGRIAYDRWADSAIKPGNWDEAIRIYKLGLEKFPGDKHLQHNLQYC